jgi:Fic family protein
MNLSEKIHLIQQLSGLTQTELAKEIGVSFPSLNSWINGKSQARKKNMEKIDALYLEWTDQDLVSIDPLHAKKELLFSWSKKYKNIILFIQNRPDLFDQLILSFTYHTNSIEGSTLTENETADILFEDRVIKNKYFIEHLEAKNHQLAMNYLFKRVELGFEIDEDFILTLHEILMRGIRDDAGFYRRHGVRIVGSRVVTANHIKVPHLMRNLTLEMNEKSKDVFEHVSRVHSLFEKIHPFSDGNGRVGRLVMAAMFLRENLAPALVHQDKKRIYYNALQKAQVDEDYLFLEEFICDSVLNGFLLLKS